MDTIQQIAGQFGFDWPNFFAQVILILTVYFILKAFAFKPVIAMLENRRKRIEEAEENAIKVRKQLEEAETRYQQILSEASKEAQRLVDEARESGDLLSEKKKQEAISEAERIIAKAREAMGLEHDKLSAELRRELGRLVVETTSKISGKILTADDQKRLGEEAARQAAA